MMKAFYTVSELIEWRSAIDGGVGFVPTMGYLHDGHLSLVREAKIKCDVVVVSIFVNPKQFNQAEDLEKYPRDLKRDLELLRQEGIDCVFLPNENEVYPAGYKERDFDMADLGAMMCANFRPGHFEGVVKVLDRFFEIVNPDFVFMGQKDLLQCLVVEKMINDFGYDVGLVVVPTVRDKRGVAYSSRNARLSDEAYEKAVLVAQKLCSQGAFEEGEIEGVEFEYVEDFDVNGWKGVAVAYWVEGVRLIDNVLFEGHV